jgi:hypothetical protein
MMDRDIDFEHYTMTAIVESAADFGLSQDEILNTVVITLDHLPGDTKANYVDGLAGALAARLVEKQRGS